MRMLITCVAGLAASTAMAGPMTYTGGGGSIPDNGGVANQFTSTLTVADSLTISDLNLELYGFAHTFVGDLIITLEHGGTSVVVVNRPGVPEFSGFGWGYNLDGDYVFDDSAGVTWDDVNGGVQDSSLLIAEGSYLGENLLSAFNGMDVMGDWTLTISDNASLDSGSLSSWGISVIPAPGAAALFGFGGLLTARRRR